MNTLKGTVTGQSASNGQSPNNPSGLIITGEPLVPVHQLRDI